jgi:diguanylate cyclase (GGDEF)-like protein
MKNDTLVIDVEPGHRDATSEPLLVRARWIRRLPRQIHILLGVVSVTCIAAIDWLTGPEATMSLLYVLAVMAATWMGTRLHGYLIAILAAAESMAAHLAWGGHRAVPIALWNASIRLGVLVTIAWLLCRLRSAIATQRHHASVDPLTGTLNRRAFQEAAERERLRALRNGSPLSIVYLDLDHFKAVNDEHGHRAGDRILRQFSATVHNAIRGSDLLARIGGDEFVLVLPAADARDAVTALHRVRAQLDGTDWEIGRPIHTSIGIATFRTPPGEVDTMVDEADRLMYRAKQLGGNRIVGAVIAGPWVAWSTDSATVDVAITPTSGNRLAG